MKGIQITRTSVHCDKAWHEYYREITDRRREVADTIPFATMTQAFVTLACIGRAEQHYIELSSRQEIFIAPSLDRTLHVPVLVSLAYERLVQGGQSQEEAIEIASKSDGFVPVVEGWAQGGVEIFQSEVARSGLPATEWLASYVGAAAKKIL